MKKDRLLYLNGKHVYANVFCIAAERESCEEWIVSRENYYVTFFGIQELCLDNGRVKRLSFVCAWINTHTYTQYHAYTHTHIQTTNRGLLLSSGILNPAVDIHFSFHGWTWTSFISVWVRTIEPWTFPLYPYLSPWLEPFFTRMCLCDLLPIGGFWQSWTSTVSVTFLMCVHG